MSERLIEVLLLLHKENRLLRPGYVGSTLWGRRGRQPQHYARPAGKLLNKLKRFGFVEWVREKEDWGWRLTPKGLALAKEQANQ